MLNKAIAACFGFGALTLLVFAGTMAWGVFAYQRLPVDAFPDISPVMVPVFAEAHGLAPEEVERLIAVPLESAMNGLPGVTEIKSTSAFGMAVVYVYFRDDIGMDQARQWVDQRLGAAMAQLPPLDEPPVLGPISTGLGQIFIYYLTLEPGAETGGKEPHAYLREINDWVVKPQLQTTPGVTEILSIGGQVLQYQIRADPYALHQYGIRLDEVAEAVRANNRNEGGQFLVLGGEEHLVRGIGLVQSLEDIGNIPLRSDAGVAVRVSDVAEVVYGSAIRRGVVTRNGEEEAVSGIVLKLYGENTSAVIARLYERLDAVQARLPEGVRLVASYEQADLVRQATRTVTQALGVGALLVLIVLFVFLGNIRSAVIVGLSLPFCALFAAIAMGAAGLSANLMSLGGIAIAIGMLGDGAIVMVENIHRHLNQAANRERPAREVVLEAAGEVSRPILFSIGIIVLVFAPILTLEGVEGKMFRPLAFTICFALAGSALSALFLSPLLAGWLLSRGEPREFALLRALKALYRPILAVALAWRRWVMGLSLGLLAAGLAVVPRLGAEFIPTLEEGSILIGVTMAPSISLEKATATVLEIERVLVAYPEVRETLSRIGRPEAGSHPHPVNYAEVHLELEAGALGRGGRSKADLIEAMDRDLERIPGIQANFTQPIQNAFDELLSGVKAEIAVKVYGEDLLVLREAASAISAAIEDVPGLVDLAAEQSLGQPQIQVVANREACARYGVSVEEILGLVGLAVGGETIDQIFLNTRRFDIHLRYQERYRSDPTAIEQLLVHTAGGATVPLGQVAKVRQVEGPLQISREHNQRRWIIQGNVRGRDLGSVIADIQSRIGERVALPPGYFVEYGGQFENQQRAMRRLSIIVPVVLGGILVLLWASFHSLRDALIIVTNVPLALVGGVFGLYVSGEYLSVPASVGFIALFGIAVQNGVVLVSYFNQLRDGGRSVRQAVEEGALLRLRPVLMTALTTVLGLLPLLLATGVGSEVQRPLAVVVVSGLATSTLLTLGVLPAVYLTFAGRPSPSSGRATSP